MRVLVVGELEIAIQSCLQGWDVIVVVEIDVFVLDGAPQALDPRTSMLIRMPAPSRRLVNASDVNCAPWSVLKTLGVPCVSAFCSATWQKKPSGGFNIYPREVEDVLSEHPAVKQAVAAGIPDECRGEMLKVHIVLKEGMTADEGEIFAFCRERLAKYKVPRAVEFRRERPMTMVGKVLRRALVEEEHKKLEEKYTAEEKSE